MFLYAIVQFIFFFLILIFISNFLGRYLSKVFLGERVLLSIVVVPIENFIYKIAGVDSKKEQDWKSYGISLIIFNLIGFLFLYLILRLQNFFPLNPELQSSISQDLAFNTSISFVTNTNWQSYNGGETTMSYFSQMLGLTVQNFLSAGTGISASLVIIRAFARDSSSTVGNFWVDLTRSILYVLMPVSVIFAIIFIIQGVPQNFNNYTNIITLEGAKQIIAQGPVATQLSIKMFGTNGGGFFNANSAHPYENPNVITNFLQCILILSLGGALTNVFGRSVGNTKEGWALFATMSIIFIIITISLFFVESESFNAITSLGVDNNSSINQSGGNMEGKEVRFGIFNSIIFASSTTAASCGAVNSMHDSYTPLGGMLLLLNILFGEIIFGGVGSGLYGILLFTILAMFLSGLMVGRTPEYLGKKLEKREVKLTMLAILVFPFIILGLTSLSLTLKNVTSNLSNNGPHGFTEILYAFSSATGNNGSAFAGLNSNNLYFNITLGIAMLFGRFAILVPMLAAAGSIANKKKLPSTSGTFPTDSWLFVILLIAIIVVVGGLTFFPALALGPIVEHSLLLNKIFFK